MLLKVRIVEMKEKLFVVLFILTSINFAQGQVAPQLPPDFGPRLPGPNELNALQDTVLVEPGRPSVELALRAFYRSIQSFVSVLESEKRVAGRGWAIGKSDYEVFKNAVSKAVEKRSELFREATGIKEETSDDFWKKVVDAEIASEKELTAMLEQVLDPDQQESFFIEHSRDLSLTILTSATFREKANLDQRTVDTLSQIKKNFLTVHAAIVNGKPMPPGKLISVSRDFIACLKPEQLDIFLVLTGRKDADISLEEHISYRMGSEERRHFLDAIPALKKFVKTDAIR
jgi:hypothetical protein